MSENERQRKGWLEKMADTWEIFCRFYKGKRVLVTGHTGFKGSWLCRILMNMGAEVTGYAKEPKEEYEY